MANGRRTGKGCQSGKQAKSSSSERKSKNDGKVKKPKGKEDKKAAGRLVAAAAVAGTASKKTNMASGRRVRRTPAEMYKSRHNIGNRSAAERVRVGSYRESEIALYFPDTYWPAVKVDFHSSPARANDDEEDGENSSSEKKPSDAHKAKSRSTSREKKRTPNSASKDDELDTSPSKKKDTIHLTESLDSEDGSEYNGKLQLSSPKKTTATAGTTSKKDSKTPSSQSNLKSASRTPSPKKTVSHNESKALEAAKKETKSPTADGKKPDKAVKPNKNPAGKAGKLPVTSSKVIKRTGNNNSNLSKTNKVGTTTVQSPEQKKSDGAKTVAVKSKSKKDNKQVEKPGSSSSVQNKTVKKEKRIIKKYAQLKPRAPRIKRTACLNAGVITSLMLECDEPVSKRRKSDVTKDETKDSDSVVKTELKSPSSASKNKKHDRELKVKKERDSEDDELQSSKKKKKKQDKDSAAKTKAPAKNKDSKGKGKASTKKKTEKAVKRKVELPEISLWPPPKRMASLNAQAILAACSEDWPSVKRQKHPVELKLKCEDATEESPVKHPDSPQKKSETSTATDPDKLPKDSPVKRPCPVKEVKDQGKSGKSPCEPKKPTSAAGSSPDVEITKVAPGSGDSPNKHQNKAGPSGHGLPSPPGPQRDFIPSTKTPASVQCPLPTPPPSTGSLPYRGPTQPGMHQAPRPPGGTQPPGMPPYPQPNFHPRFPPQYLQPPHQYPMQHPEVQPVPSYPPQSNTPQKSHFKPGYEPHCPTPVGGSASGFQHVGKVEKPSQSNAPWDMNNPSPVKRQHNTVHKSAPMGNTCTYPYPHSNAHNTSSQAYPMAGTMSMEATGTYSMMPYPKHYGNTFYNQQQQMPYGYYQPAGPLLQTIPGEPCCMPPAMSMQVPQPQVKVLVHNAGVAPSSTSNALPVDMSRAGMRQSSTPFSMPNRGVVDMSMNARNTPVSMASGLPPPPSGNPMGMHHPGMPLQGMHSMTMMQAHMNMAQPPLDYSRAGYSMGSRPVVPPQPIQRTAGPAGMTTSSTQLSAPMPDMSQTRIRHPNAALGLPGQHAGAFRGNRMQSAHPHKGAPHHPCNPKSETVDARSEGDDSVEDNDRSKKSVQNNDSDYVILNLDSIKQDKSPGGRDSVQPAVPFSAALLADMPRQCAPGPKLERLSPASAPELSRPASDMWTGNPRSSRGAKQDGKKQDKAERTKKPVKSDGKSPRKDPKASNSKSANQKLTEQQPQQPQPAISNKNPETSVAKSSGAAEPASKHAGETKSTSEKQPQSRKHDGNGSSNKNTPSQEGEVTKAGTESLKSNVENPSKPKSGSSNPKKDSGSSSKREENPKGKKEETATKAKKDSNPVNPKRRSHSEPVSRPSSLGGKLSPRGKLPSGGKQALSPGAKGSPSASRKMATKASPASKVLSPSKAATGLKVPCVVKGTTAQKSPSGGKRSPGLKVPNEGKLSPGPKVQNGGKSSPRLKVPNGGKLIQGLNVQTGGKVSPGLKLSGSGKLSPGARQMGGSGKLSVGGKVSPTPRRREVVKVLNCQWHWEGETRSKPVYVQVDVPPVERPCYASIKHDDGDIIRERDCVLVKSGPRKKDIPYVAKIAALWETDAGEMMMSVLWYYRPEHTETERLPHYINCEVFASKHCDQIPVACIDDKCHVLTFNEYCRYKTEQKRIESGHLPRPGIVPPGDLPDDRRHLPAMDANPETVFLCRKVYDLKRKRVLKNPHPNMPASPMPPKTPPSAGTTLTVTPAATASSVAPAASAGTAAPAAAAATSAAATAAVSHPPPPPPPSSTPQAPASV